jgi:ADP-heptose:LPS heptosyltransferase
MKVKRVNTFQLGEVFRMWQCGKCTAIYAGKHAAEQCCKPLNILVIRNDHIGDLFFSTCVFRELKISFPDCKLTVIVAPGTRELIKHDKNIDRVLELPIAQYNWKSIKQYWKMSRTIRSMNFDVGIDLRGSNMNSGFLLWLAGIPVRIGKSDAYESKKKQRLMEFLLTHPIYTDHHNSTKHLMDENLEIVNMGLKMWSENSMPQLITDKKDKQEVKAFLKEHKAGRKFVCVLPLASTMEKQWDYWKWQEIIKDIAKKGYRVIVMGSQKEMWLLTCLALNSSSAKNNKVSVVTDFNIRQLVLLFQKSKLTIGSDSGPLHIAGASGCPIVFLSPIFPPIHKHGKFLPLGDAQVVWAKNKDMSSISLKMVQKAIRKQLR